MGLCFPNKETEPVQQKNKNIEQVDIVKVKLKQARDKINNFINAKNKDIAQIDVQLRQKIPKYQQTGNKKQLVPLLKTKKDLQTLVQNGQVRVRLINDKISQVQMQQINKQTVDVLQQSNKYVKEIQRDLQKRDWRGILDQAKQKYAIEWPEQQEENMQEDQTFQKLWDQIGGNKIPAKKNIKAQIPQKQVQVNENNNEKNVMHA